MRFLMTLEGADERGVECFTLTDRLSNTPVNIPLTEGELVLLIAYLQMALDRVKVPS